MSLGRIGTSAAVVSGALRRNEMGIVRRIVVSALALGLCTLAFGVAVAPADSSNAALHVSGECEVFDGNGNLQEGIPFKGVANNNNGFIVCKGQVPNDTGHVVKWDQNNNPFGTGTQYSCEPPFNTVSTAWSTVVSASGQSTTKINCGTTR